MNAPRSARDRLDRIFTICGRATRFWPAARSGILVPSGRSLGPGPTLRISVTCRWVLASAVAISVALGRSEGLPAAYLTARPIARPPSKVSRNDSTVVSVAAKCTRP